MEHEPEEDGKQIQALIMPFICVKSVGGEYDDDAFVAGYRLGMLDKELSLGNAVTWTVRDIEVEQADLIAMQHGATIIVEEIEDGWRFLRISRTEVKK